MELKEIMTRPVEVIHPEATLKEAALKMKQLDVGLLPVCDGKRLVGMLSDRDITIRNTAQGQDPNVARVRDAMTKDVVYCFDDEEIHDAADVMEKHQIRRLIVLDRNKDLVGIVALADLAVHCGDDRLSGEVVERISEPAGAAR